MDIIFLLTIIGIFASIIWNLINTLQNYRQNKRYKTIILKLPMKKRVFNELYNFAKDFTDRMEFTEEKEHNNYRVYNFRLRNKEGSGYIDMGEQRILVKKLFYLLKTAFIVCDYKEGKGVDIHERALIKATMDKSYFTYPNYQLPKDHNEIKKKLLQDIIINAKENGIKIKE